MGVVVDRGAAAVHADLPGPDWRERAYGTRPGVIQRKRHRVSPSEGVGPKTKGRLSCITGGRKAIA
ncbi:hypothetical protein C7S15_6099 [Burkholderia cepacia]|nr:hypothetical protein [Burkholderia cepacia]